MRPSTTSNAPSSCSSTSSRGVCESKRAELGPLERSLRQPDQPQGHLQLADTLLDRAWQELLCRPDAVGDRVLVNPESPRRARRAQVLLEVDTQRGAQPARMIIVGE